MIAESITEPQHYLALARMVQRYPAFPRVAKRYFFGGGRYPYACRIRTPTGVVAPVIYSTDDVWTVHEIFGREDYRADPDVRVVVDIGSNIGISALYFLTRNRNSRCYLHEPVPRNIERLRANLAGYEQRYALQEAAVAAHGGTVDFMVEQSGRYGGIGLAGEEHIRVSCRPVTEVLDEVLDRESSIDLVKIDTEGAELETVSAIRDDQLARIKTICFETRTPHNPDPQRFAMRFACETCRLEQPASAGEPLGAARN